MSRIGSSIGSPPAAVLVALLMLLPRMAAAAQTVIDSDVGELRLHVIDIAFAGIFIAGGAAGWLLSLSRRASRDRALSWLGITSAVYGLRLLETSPLPTLGLSATAAGYVASAVTYVLPLGFLTIAEERLGAGWMHSIRSMRRLQTAYIVVGLAIDAFTHPGAARAPNGAFVLLGIAVVVANGAAALRHHRAAIARELHPGSDFVLLAGSTIICLLLVINENLVAMHLLPWRASYEPLGILIVLSTYGFVQVRQLLSRDVQFAAIRQELETARTIQTSLLPRALPELTGVTIATRYMPAAEVGGDFYDVMRLDDTRLGVLIVDVAGHGVPAALVASMVKVAFRGELLNAGDPARLLGGIRDQLLVSAIERRLVTAAYFIVDSRSRTLRFSSAGHPPALLLDRNAATVEELPAYAPPLGAFRAVQYANHEVQRGAASRLALYSDGIVEAPALGGEPFGSARLMEAIASTRALDGEHASQQILERVTAWCARGADVAFEDDVTLVLIDLD